MRTKGEANRGHEVGIFVYGKPAAQPWACCFSKVDSHSLAATDKTLPFETTTGTDNDVATVGFRPHLIVLAYREIYVYQSKSRLGSDSDDV